MSSKHTTIGILFMFSVSCSSPRSLTADLDVAGFDKIDKDKVKVVAVNRSPMEVGYELMFSKDYFIDWLVSSSFFYEVTGTEASAVEATEMIGEKIENIGDFTIGGSDLPRGNESYTIVLWCRKVNESSVSVKIGMQKFR